MHIRTDHPRAVRTVEHTWIPLSDGCRLAARVWLPQDAAGDPVPAVLDAVPYRKSDGTAAWDNASYEYLAGRGFACVRLDLRGSGDSDGTIPDEYTPQEQADVAEVIAWLAEQAWCDGAVGMIGVSWGGFAALQAAANRPPALRGVVAIHCSDDRYADDVHYRGGCVLGLDMLQWSSSMAAYVAQPPDPAVVGEGWRAAWEERLEALEPWIGHWLAHQRRDAYWRQGSACEGYAGWECPVLAVGGWVDGYRDFVLRLVEHLDAPVRGLIGPWGHSSPEEGVPGPAIGFLQECVRFFDHALKGLDSGSFDEPALLSWMQEAVPPGAGGVERPGRWVADPAWPSPNVATRTLALGARTLEPGNGAAPMVRRLRGLQLCGSEAGVWCGDGGPGDLPADQRPDDGASLCWDGAPLAEPLELLGHAAAVLELEVDRPLALVAVRLCDVAPDGASALIARGVLNLTHRHGHDRVEPLEPGVPFVVRVPMQSTGYAVPAGHTLRLAVSPTYWPWAWPSPEPVTLSVLCGGESRLELPVRRPGADDARLRPFDPPEAAPKLAEETLAAAPGGRVLARDLAAGASELTFDWKGVSRTRLVATGTELEERNVTRYRLTEGDPLSAVVECDVDVGLRRGAWHPRVEVRSRMSCDAERFLVTTDVDAFEGVRRVFARRHTHSIPRDGV